MQRLKLALSCALLAALTGVAVQAIFLLHAATVATRALPGAVSAELQATRAALVAEINATRADLSNQVEAARQDLLGKADAQFSTIQSESFRQITEFRSMADRRLGDTLARADTALCTVEALRNDVKPAVDGAVALESDAKDSWDDVYWDVKALVGSATVAARGVAETSEAVGKAAPKLAESAVGIGKSTDAIAADIHTATSDFVKPKTFWQRMKAWLETAGKVSARFL
jgi:outer membrane murein-binding lipoprotein Lpp